MNDIGYNFRDQFIRHYRAIGQIIAISAGLFLLLAVIHLFFFLVNQSLVFTAFYQTIPLSTRVSSWLNSPWSWVTWLFLFRYPDFIGTLFSLVWFYWIGGIFKDFTKSVVIWSVYLQGAFFGALFAILCYAIFPVFIGMEGYIFGASAGLNAIVAASATLVPDYGITLFLLGRVRLRWIGLAIVTFNIFMIASSGNPASALAQVGAALYGFLAIRALKQGSEWHQPIQWIVSLFQPKPHNNRTTKTSSSAKTNLSRKSTMPNQAEIDRILDKIASVGYENLTTDEKQTLFNASRRD